MDDEDKSSDNADKHSDSEIMDCEQANESPETLDTRNACFTPDLLNMKKAEANWYKNHAVKKIEEQSNEASAKYSQKALESLQYNTQFESGELLPKHHICNREDKDTLEHFALAKSESYDVNNKSYQQEKTINPFKRKENLSCCLTEKIGTSKPNYDGNNVLDILEKKHNASNTEIRSMDLIHVCKTLKLKHQYKNDRYLAEITDFSSSSVQFPEQSTDIIFSLPDGSPFKTYENVSRECILLELLNLTLNCDQHRTNCELPTFEKCNPSNPTTVDENVPEAFSNCKTEIINASPISKTTHFSNSHCYIPYKSATSTPIGCSSRCSSRTAISSPVTQLIDPLSNILSIQSPGTRIPCSSTQYDQHYCTYPPNINTDSDSSTDEFYLANCVKRKQRRSRVRCMSFQISDSELCKSSSELCENISDDEDCTNLTETPKTAKFIHGIALSHSHAENGHGDRIRGQCLPEMRDSRQIFHPIFRRSRKRQLSFGENCSLEITDTQPATLKKFKLNELDVHS